MSEQAYPPSALAAPAPGRFTAVLLPLLALALVGWIVATVFAQRGPEITVRCAEGHGLKAGDLLRYRGIAVGEIEDVHLSRGLSSVVLRVRLDRDAAALASKGARFWVVRPQLSWEGVKGLETVVGSRYLRVEPGADGAPAQSEFVALDTPPLEEVVDPSGLEFVLEASKRFALAPGAPLLYRDFRVGTVLAVGLASDAASVQVRCYVRPPYVQLIREDTRFWETGGFELELALLEGLRLELGSLTSLLIGAISLATPDDPGPVVHGGHSFALASAPKEEWLTWRPTLPIGSELMPKGVGRFELVRGHLRWKEKGLLGSEKRRSGWLVPVAGGCLGPATFLAPEDAKEGSLVLELAGREQSLAVGIDWREHGLARIGIPLENQRPWPYERIRRPSEPEDCLVVLDSTMPPRALDAGRLLPDEGGFVVDGSLPFSPEWQGAAIVARADGFLVGVLLLDEPGGARVAFPPISAQ